MPTKLEMRQCKSRVPGHSWDDIPVTKRPEFGEYLWFRCVRCGTVRKDIVQPFNGDLLHRAYDYPDGYRELEQVSTREGRMLVLKSKRRLRAVGQ